jgi:hypothetical protein
MQTYSLIALMTVRFHQYVDQTEGGIPGCAKAIGVHVECVRKWYKYRSIPRAKHFRKLREWSGYVLTMDSFLPPDLLTKSKQHEAQQANEVKDYSTGGAVAASRFSAVF